MFSGWSSTPPRSRAQPLDEEPVEITAADVANLVDNAGKKEALRHEDAEVVFNLTEADSTPIFSGICLTAYIGIWISSVLSPAIFTGLYLTGNYKTLSVLLGLAALSYAPVLPHLAWLRSFFGNANPRYFKNCSLRLEAPVDEKKPTVVCVHPHGLFCLGWGQLFITDALKHVNFCFSGVLYMSPFFRLFTRLLGKPAAVDKKSIIGFMKKGESLALIPGGFEDATLHCLTVDRTFIKARKGFVKYALQYGYTITPAFSFGERGSFDNYQGNYEQRFKLNAMGIPTITPKGLSWFPILPKRCDIHIVVGAPLKLQRIEKPTAEDVDKAHKMYIDHLVALYDRHKDAFYGEGAAELEIW